MWSHVGVVCFVTVEADFRFVDALSLLTDDPRLRGVRVRNLAEAEALLNSVLKKLDCDEDGAPEQCEKIEALTSTCNNIVG